MPSVRSLAMSWLVVTVPIAAAAVMMLLVSDRPEDAGPGWALSLLALSGIAMSIWLFTSPSPRALAVSLATSTAWIAVAIVVYPSFDFVADVLWSVGFITIGAVVTAALAARAQRAEH